MAGIQSHVQAHSAKKKPRKRAPAPLRDRLTNEARSSRLRRARDGAHLRRPIEVSHLDNLLRNRRRGDILVSPADAYARTTSESPANSAAMTSESPPSLPLPRVPIATMVEFCAEASRGRREKYAAGGKDL
jgi:hypothetical protein